MSKKILIPVILVLFIPTIIGIIWFYSSSDKVTGVTLVDPEGKEVLLNSSENDFYISLASNLVPIEKQVYSPESWSLYVLTLEKSFDKSVYYLCISQDEKNCLAYDDDGQWYRIKKEDAAKFLVRGEAEKVYDNSEPPEVFVTMSGHDYSIPATSYSWNYKLADGSLSSSSDSSGTVFDSGLNVSSSVNFGVSFSVEPSYFDIKIFDGDTKVFSCNDTLTLSEFTYSVDKRLKAVIHCIWDQSEEGDFYGESLNEFFFNYDLRATAELDKDEYSPGEIAFITLGNADSDVFDITTSLSTSSRLKVRDYNGVKYLLVPISAYNRAGDYTLTLKSETATLNLVLKIKEWSVDDSNVSVDLSADDYNAKVNSFVEMITALPEASSVSEPYWKDGLLTPLVKFVDGEEQYWITSPTYGAVQVVDGAKNDAKTFGRYYVKAYALEAEGIEIDVRSVARGVVSYVGETELFGNVAVIDHGFGLCSVYGHVTTEYRVGDEVEAGANFAKTSGGGIVLGNNSGQIFFALMQDGVFLSPNRFITEHTPESDPMSKAPVTGFIK